MVLCASLPLELTGSISTKNKTNPGSQSRNLGNLSDVDKERQKQRQICGADAAERRREFDLLMNKMRMGQKEAVNPRVEKPRWGAAALEDGAGPKPTSSSGVTHQELREAATRYAEAWARLMVRQLGFRFTPSLFLHKHTPDERVRERERERERERQVRRGESARAEGHQIPSVIFIPSTA